VSGSLEQRLVPLSLPLPDVRGEDAGDQLEDTHLPAAIQVHCVVQLIQLRGSSMVVGIGIGIIIIIIIIIVIGESERKGK